MPRPRDPFARTRTTAGTYISPLLAGKPTGLAWLCSAQARDDFVRAGLQPQFMRAFQRSSKRARTAEALIMVFDGRKRLVHEGDA